MDSNKFKYKFALWKAYFDKGYGFTSYFKYLIAFYGVSSLNVVTTMILGLIYAPFCLLLGKTLYKYGFIDAEHEVQNKVNPFVKEMRSNFAIPNNRNI